MSLVTPKEIDDAFVAVFDDVAHYRSEMKRLDETMSDGWLNLVDADREGRSHATLNASAYAHRDDGVRARFRILLSDDALGESADDFALTPANAAASPSGAAKMAAGGATAASSPKPAYAASLVNLEELAPSSPIWSDIKAAASVSAPKAAGARTGKSGDSNNSSTGAGDEAGSSGPEGGDNDDESEYDFADDPELDALISGGSGGNGVGKDVAAAKLRDRRARPAPAATVSSSSSSSATGGAASAPAAPLFTSAEALQAWFAPLPLPSLNDAQRSFVAALTAALTVAGRKRRLEALIAQLERITAEPFALDDTSAVGSAKGGAASTAAAAAAAPAVPAGPE